jgi:hypothetical protein
VLEGGVRAVGHSKNTRAGRNIRLKQVQDPGVGRILHLLQDLGTGYWRPPALLDAGSAAWIDREHHHITDDVSSHRRQGNVAAGGNRCRDGQVDLRHARIASRALIEDGRLHTADINLERSIHGMRCRSVRRIAIGGIGAQTGCPERDDLSGHARVGKCEQSPGNGVGGDAYIDIRVEFSQRNGDTVIREAGRSAAGVIQNLRDGGRGGQGRDWQGKNQSSEDRPGRSNLAHERSLLTMCLEGISAFGLEEGLSVTQHIAPESRACRILSI